jgi:hypothetical protein
MSRSLESEPDSRQAAEKECCRERGDADAVDSVHVRILDTAAKARISGE